MAPTAIPSWHDPNRPALVQWRWAVLRPNQIEGTIYKGMDPRGLDIDTELLESIFKAPPARKPGQASEGGDAVADEKTAVAAAKAAQYLPPMLDGGRLQNIEMKMRKFEVPVETLRHSIITANTSILTEDVVDQLISLFPAKSYETEMGMLLTNFSGDPGKLCPTEYFLRTLLTIPDIPTKLANLKVGQELPTRVTAVEEMCMMIGETLDDMHKEELKEFLTFCFAIGVYLNNPKGAPPGGIQLSSLLKLQDTKSRVGKSVTLLHVMVDMMEKSKPHLVNWYTTIRHVTTVKQLVESFIQEIAYLAKSNSQLARTIAALIGPEDAQLHAHFSKVKEVAQAELKKAEAFLARIHDTIKYFGEKTNEDVEFFNNWARLATTFETALKFNISQRKREEALKLKEEQDRIKKEEAEERKLLASIRGNSAQRQPSSPAASSNDPFGPRASARRRPGASTNNVDASTAPPPGAEDEFADIMASIVAAAEVAGPAASDNAQASARAARRRQGAAESSAEPAKPSGIIKNRVDFESLRRNRQSNDNLFNTADGATAERARRAVLRNPGPRDSAPREQI